MKFNLAPLYFCLMVLGFFAGNGFSQERDLTITGTVVDFLGRSWEGATVRLRSKELISSKKGDREVSAVERETKTDVDGRYVFQNLPLGTYEATLETVGGLREVKDVPIIMTRDIVEVDFGLEIGSIGDCPSHTIYGSVKNKQNKVLVGAKISVINAFNQRRVISAKTDRNGIYKLDLCNPGQYIVFSGSPNFKVQSASVVFLPKVSVRRIDFVLLPLITN